MFLEQLILTLNKYVLQKAYSLFRVYDQVYQPI